MRRILFIFSCLFTIFIVTNCAAPEVSLVTPTAEVLSTPFLSIQTPEPAATPQDTPVPTPIRCTEKNGRIINVDVPTDKLTQPVNTNIYLPPCYDPMIAEGYSMLLMLHGQAASNDQWIRLGITNAADDLIRQEEILPLIIVMPFEVTWTPGPSESQFDEALLEDVLPYVEANYAVCAQRACRAVGGLSRGGNWAVHLGFTHPEIFGVIGAHSTPLFYGEIWNIQAAAKLPADEIPLIFVDAGDRDADKEKVAEFVTALEEAGIPFDFFEFEGRHEESYWSAHVVDYLRLYAERLTRLQE